VRHGRESAIVRLPPIDEPQEPTMKLHPNHVLSIAALIAVAIFAEFATAPAADTAAASSDPSVPAASTVLKASDSREGNVQDLTY
jgi:hypothetical protein